LDVERGGWRLMAGGSRRWKRKRKLCIPSLSRPVKGGGKKESRILRQEEKGGRANAVVTRRVVTRGKKKKRSRRAYFTKVRGERTPVQSGRIKGKKKKKGALRQGLQKGEGASKKRHRAAARKPAPSSKRKRRRITREKKEASFSFP